MAFEYWVPGTTGAARWRGNDIVLVLESAENVWNELLGEDGMQSIPYLFVR